ncbi:ATP-binding protein [Streptomyces sp. NBC_01142]|uniref:AlbA family DNA-binding domain-containing protein n=1 Tax=Streptomyces sp. NBC_01142 TaxID=2975865 RepID=UPI002255E858|nr:ATP-binding protein [Streptomyces sp. NBC_01142]MCX4824881.1 ATP-binding protein [Streptomyces sp. NBC_01142]
MASTWTRIHQELGVPPGPLTYELVAQAAADIDGERDDLDWKRDLPKKAEPGEWNEFAKDVAAMANARGGLLIYGVRNDRTITGVDPQAVNTEHLHKWLRANTQPYVAGVDAYTQSSADGSKTVLVVDVPASAMAPHFVLGSSQRDRQLQAFAVPFRYSDHTGWLAEHEIDRAYRDRYARQAAADEALERHLEHAREVVLTGDPSVAWLIVVSRPARPIPPLVPSPARHEANDVLSAALRTAADIQGEFRTPGLMRSTLVGNPQVGLQRWVEGNFLHPFKGPLPKGRLLMVELHHDGTVVYAVDVSSFVLAKNAGPNTPNVAPYLPVESLVVQVGVCEAVALAHEFRMARRIDSSTDLTAVVTCNPEAHRRGSQPFAGFAPVLERNGFMDVPSGARCPTKLLPAGSELPPAPDSAALRDCAQSLSAGVLNQLGIESIFI